MKSSLNADDLFISYKREDQPEARKLADALESTGWSVWWDPKLRSGDYFDDVIEQAIRRVTSVIVLWSRLAVDSSYVKDEATFALKLDKLVPVALDDAELPMRFARLHTISLRGWDGSTRSRAFQELKDAPERKPGRPHGGPKRADLFPDVPANFPLVGDSLRTRFRPTAGESGPPDACAPPAIPQYSTNHAVADLQRRSERGDCEAQFDLARRLLEGAGIPKDVDQGLRWLRHAGTAGHLGAKYELGRRLVRAGAVQNLDEGVRWLTEAAKEGYPGAEWELKNVSFRK